MIKIEKSSGAHSGSRALLPGNSPFHDPVSFVLQGNRTSIGCSATRPAPEQVQMNFRPADPRADSPERHGKFSDAERDNILCLLASPDGRFGSLRINAAVKIYTCLLSNPHQITYRLPTGRHLHFLVRSGELAVGEVAISAGQLADVSNLPEISLKALEDSEFLMLELA